MVGLCDFTGIGQRRGSVRLLYRCWLGSGMIMGKAHSANSRCSMANRELLIIAHSLFPYFFRVVVMY